MITIDTIGDMIIRRWRWMEQEIECEHCKKPMTIRVTTNDLSYKNINEALDLKEKT